MVLVHIQSRMFEDLHFRLVVQERLGTFSSCITCHFAIEKLSKDDKHVIMYA
jgi:hypothetical protein